MQWQVVSLVIAVMIQAGVLVYTYGKLTQRVEALEENYNRLWDIVMRGKR
jgi:hypothetical protein